MGRDGTGEAEILAGCRAGDSRAATRLVELHQQVMLRVAGRLVGRWDVAEEIVQEAFMRVFQKIRDIDPDRGARQWLLQTVVNLSHDWVHRVQAREAPARLSSRSQPLFAQSDDPEASAVSAERRSHLARAIEKLSPRLRDVVVLHYIEGMSFAEVSTILRTPVSALRVRALRARLQLGRLLERDDAP